MRQSTLTQQFAYEDQGSQENNVPTLPLGWHEVVDKFSGQTYFIHAATKNVVFSREEIYKKPPAAAVAARAPSFSLPDAALSEPTFPSVFVVSPPPAGRRARKKASKPVVINLMASGSEEEDDSETDDEENKKPRPHVTTQDLLVNIPLPDGDSKKPYVTSQDLMNISLPGDSQDEDSDKKTSDEDSDDDDDESNKSPVLL